MKKIGTWFLNMSRVAQVSTIGVLMMGGMFGVGAMSQSSTNPSAKPLTTQKVEAKAEPVVATKVETEAQSIVFEKTTQETNSLNKGETQISRAGVDGVKTLTHTITLKDGIEVNRTTVESVTTQPISELTLVGTYEKPVPRCDGNYSGCVPIVSYDLDCADIGQSIIIYGNDPHGFDRDRDGYGCESY